MRPSQEGLPRGSTDARSVGLARPDQDATLHHPASHLSRFSTDELRRTPTPRNSFSCIESAFLSAFGPRTRTRKALGRRREPRTDYSRCCCYMRLLPVATRIA